MKRASRVVFSGTISAQTGDMPTLSGFVARAQRPLQLVEDVAAHTRMRQWASANRPQAAFSDRQSYYEHLHTSVLGQGPIIYLEFGVKRGASMKKWLALNTHPESEFVGFDTFTGIPEEWEGRQPGAMSCNGQLPRIVDSRVRFLKGLFQDTLPGFLADFRPRHRIVINNDSDLGSSTLYVLTRLDPWMVPGSILLLDEFFSGSHEFQAFIQYSKAYRREVRFLAAELGHNYVQRPFRRVSFEML